MIEFLILINAMRHSFWFAINMISVDKKFFVINTFKTLHLNEISIYWYSWL